MCTPQLSVKSLLHTWCLKSNFIALMYVFTHLAVLRINYTSCSLNWFGSQEHFLLFCVWKVIEVKNLTLDSVAIAVKCLDCESHACCHLWVAVPLPQSPCLPKTGVLHHQMSGGIHWRSLHGLFSKFDKNLLRMCNLKQGSVSQGLVTLGGKCLNSSLFIVVEFLPVYITVEDLLKIIFWLCKCLSSFCKFIFYEMTLDTFLPSLPCSNKSTLSQTVCILTLFLISGFVRNKFFFNATVTVPLHFNFLVVLLLAECFVTGTKTFVFVPGWSSMLTQSELVAWGSPALLLRDVLSADANLGDLCYRAACGNLIRIYWVPRGMLHALGRL